MPNEILAIILQWCDPADIPAVQATCTLWRDLAPEREPDLVLAVRYNLWPYDDEAVGLFVVPRARARRSFVDMLCVESMRGDSASHEDDDGQTRCILLMDECDDAICSGHEIGLYVLIANMRQHCRKARLFSVDVDENPLEYRVVRYRDEYAFATWLIEWACKALDIDRRSFIMHDLDTDDGLEHASRMLRDAQRAMEPS
jgi:hypothetical protein